MCLYQISLAARTARLKYMVSGEKRIGINPPLIPQINGLSDLVSGLALQLKLWSEFKLAFIWS